MECHPCLMLFTANANVLCKLMRCETRAMMGHRLRAGNQYLQRLRRSYSFARNCCSHFGLSNCLLHIYFGTSAIGAEGQRGR